MALIRDDDVSTNDEVQYCDSLVVCARDCVAAIQLVLSSKLIQLELLYQTLHMFDDHHIQKVEIWQKTLLQSEIC